MESLDYLAAVRELESRGIMPERVPSLEPTRQGLERIGFFATPFARRLEQDSSRVVIVAGTNGKGSVCATLEALLQSAGERVGLYTSPHLIDTTERIRLGGHDISRADFALAHDFVRQHTADLKLSHFEMLTLMAIWAFTSGQCGPTVDRIVLEVGLGGTWDSTNAVPHGACVITNLGLDHQQYLGNTIINIARNKFGVVTSGSWVVHAPLPPEVTELAAQVRAATRSEWICESMPKQRTTYTGGNFYSWALTPWGEAPLALVGARAAQNTVLALRAFARLGHDPRAHLKALAAVKWPGRMERVYPAGARCPVYMSGDHNPQGVQSLLEILTHAHYQRLHLIVGLAQDKDCDGILTQLAAIPRAQLYLTQTSFKPRLLMDYGEWLKRATASDPDAEQMLERVVAEAEPGDLILVTGSLYLVGALRAHVLRNQ